MVAAAHMQVCMASLARQTPENPIGCCTTKGLLQLTLLAVLLRNPLNVTLPPDDARGKELE
jgi:hypothetical protein